MPESPEDASAIVQSATDAKTTGHTEWPDGRVHHTGFTACFPPNTRIPCEIQGQMLDCDYNSWQEGRDGIRGLPTYAIVVSRSYHPGGVNAVHVDGSARFYSQTIEKAMWQALATRAGGEILASP